ncbi:MAG: transposase, partial [Pseudomonadota bacterium]
MKSSKAEIQAKYHKIPVIRFEDQKLSSFSGLLIFQVLFRQLRLRERLKKCFEHMKVSPIFGRHLVVLLLIVHLLLGFRRLREVDYYRDDPLVLRPLDSGPGLGRGLLARDSATDSRGRPERAKRVEGRRKWGPGLARGAPLMGLRKLPDVSTISRALCQMEGEGVEKVRELSTPMVIEGLKREALYRLTFDFDGSVQSTKGHAEETAVGFNKTKKGARSYYPLFCTVAQSGQFFDLLHRPGNVHDSNGADEFMMQCFQKARAALPNILFESLMDSAFFSQNTLVSLGSSHVKFTASMPFERFPELKSMIEQRNRWRVIDREWAYFETQWKPKSWDTSYRFLFIRKKVKSRQKGPLQLHLFEPRDLHFDYKVIVTNKTESAKSVVLFHNGRGSQETIFGDAKTDAALDALPSTRLAGNQIFTLCAMMAHNLSREIQML